DHEKILRASQILVEERVAQPILLGDLEKIRDKADDLGVNLDGVEMMNPADSPFREQYLQELYRLRQRRGVTLSGARKSIDNRTLYGCLMVHLGDADALLAGVTQHYPDTIRPALQIVKVREGLHKVSALYIMVTKRGDLYFLADVAVNIDPSA